MIEVVGWATRRYIRTWYGQVPIKLLAEAVGLTPLQVAQVLREENLLNAHVLQYKRWAIWEVETLLRMYSIHGTKAIGRLLGRSSKAVSRMAERLGLRNSNAERHAKKRRILATARSRLISIKPGMVENSTIRPQQERNIR